MGYRLKDGLHFCLSNGRVVLLDIRVNRYFGLSDRAETVFLGLFDAERQSDENGSAISLLLERGLLEADPGSSLPLPMPRIASVAPTRLPLDDASPSKALVASALWSIPIAAMTVKLRSLARIKAAIASRRPHATDEGQRNQITSYQSIARAFESTTLLFPPADRCLPRSLAFVALCNSVGLFPALMIGVRTNPFTAHCWVQTESHILYDQSHEANLFTPIVSF